MERQESTMASRNAARGQVGMTLIEIMIVLAIIALVMGVLVGPKVLQSMKEAKIKTARMMAKEYVGAYAQWSANSEETCPAGLEDLKKYRNKQDDKDPWGTKFEMRCGESAPEDNDFGVVSGGPDKKIGSTDDIKSWD